MVRSANLFCFRQKPWRTNSKVWVWTSYKDTIVVFVTLYADGRPPCTLSNYAGSADSRRIFSRTGNRVYGRTHFPGMKINFWLERGARTHNLFNLVLLRLRRPLVSTAAAARSLLPWCSPLSSTTSLWAVVVADVLVVHGDLDEQLRCRLLFWNFPPTTKILLWWRIFGVQFYSDDYKQYICKHAEN